MVGGDAEVLTPVLDAFLQQCPSLCEDLRSAARAVEERAAQGGGAVPDDLVRTLEAELDAVRPELERYVKGAAGAPERSGG